MATPAPDERYVFVPLNEDGYEIYAGWFAAGPTPWVQAPTRQWFDYIQGTPTAQAWMVYTAEGDAVGQVQLDEEPDQCGSLLLTVRPGERGRGRGRQILRALLSRPELAGLRTIEASIDPANAASLRCCLAAGFVQASAAPDGEGLLRFEYRVAPD